MGAVSEDLRHLCYGHIFYLRPLLSFKARGECHLRAGGVFLALLRMSAFASVGKCHWRTPRKLYLRAFLLQLLEG